MGARADAKTNSRANSEIVVNTSRPGSPQDGSELAPRCPEVAVVPLRRLGQRPLRVTMVVVATRPRAMALGRVAAVLALGSAAVHLLLLDASLGSVVMVGMAACLPCAWHLWRSPTGSVWRLTAGVDAAMLVRHAQLRARASICTTARRRPRSRGLGSAW